ncbi:MAG: hypothetical protein H0W83_12760 [Planctomycetes bacterium]|nr:hypothetical protein [Planctomycetota bacterium]
MLVDQRRSCSIAVVIALGVLCAGGLSAAVQERPLLTRPVLGEVVVADFAKPGTTAKAVHPQTAVRVVEGRCEASFPAREEAPSVVLRSGPAIDLAGMDVLRFDIENAAADRVAATLVLGGTDGAPHALFDLPLDLGANAFVFPVWTMTDEKGGAFDRAHLGEISLTVQRRATPAVLRIGRISGQKLFTDCSRVRIFDFGKGSVAPGATPVRAASAYSKERGFGVAGEGIVEPDPWQGEFALFGDGLNGPKIDLRVDLPDGDYEAQAVVYGISWQGARCVSSRILADGKVVVDDRVTPERFRSFELQYFGGDIFFDPAKTLFDQYHRTYFAAKRFEARAHDGALAITFENAAPRALWVYPKEQAADGRALVDACYAEEGHRLWASHARVRDHVVAAGVEPTAADRKRGYVLFARDPQTRVYPNQAPAAADLIPAAGLTAACAAGEFEPVTLVIRPLQDLGATAITFTAPSLGGKPSPVEVRPFVVKYLPLQAQGMWYEAQPTLLYPYADRVLTKDWNCQYWLTVHVPAGTPGGDYAGTITIAPKNGAKTVVPVTLTVRPFDLPRSTMENGMWNCGPWSNHQLGAFPTDDALIDPLLDAETKDMSEHGLNGYQFGAPDSAPYDPATGLLALDFRHFDHIAAALAKNGMAGRHLFSILNFANYKLMNHGVKEFSPEFDKAYLAAMTQLRDWMTMRNVKGVLQVTDECRETELNDWNRNRVDTLKHLRLARKVEGLQLMVTLMGDVDGFNRPYTPLIPLMDVVSSHSWARSDDQVYLTTVEKMADLWTYNNGFTRCAFGFYNWKSKAQGHWQWVYSWECTSPHLPVSMPGDTSAAYAVPGGYLDTLKFENVREGIDDQRYLALMETTLAAAPADSPGAADAKAFLATLDKFLPAYPTNEGLITGAEAGASWDESAATAYFGQWRAQIAEYITALREKRAAKRLEAAWAMFPKALVAEQRTLVCKLIDTAPTIDGKGDDAVWTNAPEAGNFLNLARGVPAATQTTVKMVRDGKRLYALITATEAKYGELKAYGTERDDQCWADDSVELFLDTKHDLATYKHIVVNCLGTIEDSDTHDDLWNGDIAAAVTRGKGAYVVELSMSLASLGGLAPKDGVVWGANVCRNRQPQPPENSSWAFVGSSFHNAKGFGTLTFTK